MCGIVSAVSQRNIVPVLLQGLQRLEYRGYDSCGLAVHDGSGPKRARSTARVAQLQTQTEAENLQGTVGIAHTRWATHGAPAEHNAHPHFSHGTGAQGAAKIALVHNGIIENHEQLRAALQAKGYVFESQTDTEVIAHLVDYYLKQGEVPEMAAHKTFDRLRGAYAVVLMFKGDDKMLMAARQGTPLAVGYGEGEMFLASDSYALSPLTRKISFLEDGDRLVAEGVTSLEEVLRVTRE